MQTTLAPEFANTPEGREAEAILRKCVHCGFCNATCPTYQLLGDELDGPRGRIYLMKQVLEGRTPTRATQLHLDRCLTCRNCETTCPSGVQYGHLVDIGRRLVDERVPRPAAERALRWTLKEGLPSPLFAPAMRVGQAMRGLLPETLRAKVPERSAAGSWPTRHHARRILLHANCVQPAMQPGINAATARVLDAAGIQTVLAPQEGCCGAVRFHMNDQSGGREQLRALIDAWWPLVEGSKGQPGVEAIVSNVSGCGLMLKESAHVLRHDPTYAGKAERIAPLVRDLSELLPVIGEALLPRHAGLGQGRQLAYHPPCTLQHGQRVRDTVETWLPRLGFVLQRAASEAHLCCGSAGTYSVTQPELATQLRDRKLGHLQGRGDVIVSANIGCITHLQSGTPTPVRHWIEVLDQALGAAANL